MWTRFVLFIKAKESATVGPMNKTSRGLFFFFFWRGEKKREEEEEEGPDGESRIEVLNVAQRGKRLDDKWRQLLSRAHHRLETSATGSTCPQKRRQHNTREGRRRWKEKWRMPEEKKGPKNNNNMRFSGVGRRATNNPSTAAAAADKDVLPPPRLINSRQSDMVRVGLQLPVPSQTRLYQASSWQLH